ncbi:class I SAM-dependent methyltransferase [Streptomyces chumphonensis]|uniref:Class I SAM-dependent methyltransferase n=1 Tax=Streptomyces chumphonensis TaxID=1214925 RepID=A0A927F1Z9_9ACTN|nr:class I SAM-dependent methyltransferase [Streptomyces chumphonensis]MBD3932856.1 class I SAM-dependent methyltransferase [Streptomyces chumphonensis]
MTATSATPAQPSPSAAATTPPAAGAPEDALPRPTRFADVKGWFFPADQHLFAWFLDRQERLGEPGDLLELGSYLGKSAIFTGARQRPGDRFTVCDLFDAPAEDAANAREMRASYATLSRRSFEANYLAFHDALPTVVQGLTSVIRDHVPDASCRFAHIDASHLYEHVRADIEAVGAMLAPHGIVALDDYRSEHCPGVAAATWEAVLVGRLQPVCVSGNKFYGTWGDPRPVRADLLEWLSGQQDLWFEEQSVAGHPLIRVKPRKGAAEPPQPAPRHAAGASAASATSTSAPPTRRAARPAPRPRGPLGAVRRVAVDLLPPIVTRALLSALRRR